MTVTPLFIRLSVRRAGGDISAQRILNISNVPSVLFYLCSLVEIVTFSWLKGDISLHASV